MMPVFNRLDIDFLLKSTWGLLQSQLSQRMQISASFLVARMIN